MLKENGLDPMILALLQRSSLDADREHHDSNPPVTDSSDVEDVLPNHISFSEELRLQGLGKCLQRCKVDARKRRLSVRAHCWKPCLPTSEFGTRLSDLVYLTLYHSQIRTMGYFEPSWFGILVTARAPVWVMTNLASKHGSWSQGFCEIVLGRVLFMDSKFEFLKVELIEIRVKTLESVHSDYGDTHEDPKLKTPIPPLAGPTPGAIPSMSLQVTGRPVVGMYSMPQEPPIPHDFQRNLSMSNNHMPGSGGPNLPLSSSYNFSLGQRADASTDWREFTSPEGRKCVTYIFSWPLSNYSSTVDGSLGLAHGAKSSPIAMSPSANLPTIVASESSSLSSKVSSPMIEIVKIKNSSEPALPAVANSEKIGTAVNLGNSVAPPVAVVSQLLTGEEYATNSNENVKKDAAITEIGGATPSDEKTVELGPLVYESKSDCKELPPSSRWRKTVCMMVDDVLVVVGDAVSCDGGMVVSTDTVASVADGGGRGDDADDSSSDSVRRMCGMLVLIDELVGSRDRPVAVDGGGVGSRGVHGSIWVGYLSKP
ncbi:hypothetical protein FXO37_33041 [Capsicum annuum]|nr:hypothetical protein FXO37_33041 [Capsicum annuum]